MTYYDLVAGLMAIMPEILWTVTTGLWREIVPAVLRFRGPGGGMGDDGIGHGW